MSSGPVSAGREFDVVVIGGGITGMCLSWFLADAGLAVACIDHGRDSGSTTNAGSIHVQMQSRIMRLFPERLHDYRRTLSLYPLAVEFWQEIAARLDEDIELAITGGLMVAEDGEQLDSLAAKSEIENQHGIPTRIVERDELQRIAPYLSERLHGASFCELEGKVNPLRANPAIERSALAAGAAIFRETDVQAVERQQAGFALRTSAGEFHAGQVALASGAGCGRLAACLGQTLPTSAEPLHMNVTDPAEPLLKHLVQHVSRPITLKQLGSGHVVIGGGWPAGPGEGDRPPQVIRDSVLGNLQLAGEIVPRLGSLRLLRTWAGINPFVDLLSVLGELPAVPGLFVAVPGDAGYTLGPICARLVADKILDLPARYPLEAFEPQRF